MNKEILAFELYKNKSLECCNHLKNEVNKLFNSNYSFSISNLYAKIINYQIDKYGTQLNLSNYYESIDDLHKKNKLNQARIRNKKKYYIDRGRR